MCTLLVYMSEIFGMKFIKLTFKLASKSFGDIF